MKVTFDETRNKVHHMVVWLFAYKNSRRNYWEFKAMDSWRFRKRIEDTEKIINHVLEPKHRCKVYKQRFQ